MRAMYRFLLLAGIWLFALAASLSAGNWAQFRGPNATGRAEREEPLPDQIGPETNVLWKAVLPKGHSSPVIFGDRIYLTGEFESKLVTIALDRSNGGILWQTEAPYESLEEV